MILGGHFWVTCTHTEVKCQSRIRIWQIIAQTSRLKSLQTRQGTGFRHRSPRKQTGPSRGRFNGLFAETVATSLSRHGMLKCSSDLNSMAR